MNEPRTTESRAMKTAVRAAREAGEIALTNLGKDRQIRWKKLRDIVTPTALESQAKIEAIIKDDFPDHYILAEESESTLEDEVEFQWIIDPLDGTFNHRRGIPIFAISVALMHKKRAILGVVYDPCRDELFQAQRRQGAFVNDHPLRVSDREELEEAIVATDWSRSVENRDMDLKLAVELVPELITQRSIGSPSLAMCYVAAGRFDAYYHFSLEVWDVAAAVCIVEEAGGIVSDLNGGPWLYSDGDYMTANSLIHKNIIRLTIDFRTRMKGLRLQV